MADTGDLTTTADEDDLDRTRRPRGRPRDEGADGRILEAAATLMIERGAVDVTVDQVAARAGVGKATVYRRYPTKEVMAAEALNTMFSREMPVPDTGSFDSDLHALFTSIVTFGGSPVGERFLRLVAEAASRSEAVADLYRAAYERRREAFEVVIDRAMARGDLQGDVLDRLVFLDFVPSLLMFRAITRQPLPTADDVPALIEQALHGAKRP
jgi:AcrR family transcriptional regulator